MKRNILLVEPSYANKMPPLGLMKLAQYHHGDNVFFVKGPDKAALSRPYSRVYITSLFSFEYERIGEAIQFGIEAAAGLTQNVFVGGIAASLMHGRFRNDPRWFGVRVIKGLLDKAPAVSLGLDEWDGDFGWEDVAGTPIEDLVPDYSILDQVAYRYPVSDAYFVYASRGCIRSCSFCGVPKLEGGQRDARPLAVQVGEIAKRHGEKLNLYAMDNNIVASPNFKEIVASIRDLGFGAGAKLKRPGERVASKRRFDANQGVDARILARDPMYLRELATLCLSPLRIAFDHVGLMKPYERSVRMAHDFGLDSLSNYLLFNFNDTPRDLYQRMDLNTSLNEELGTRIFSFPMRYCPTDQPDRSHVGPKWSRHRLRSMQIALNATRGIVSGEPDYFRFAFGADAAAFEDILDLPHKMIFHRRHFLEGAGRAEREAYEGERARLSDSQKLELGAFLSAHDPSRLARASRDLDPGLRSAAAFHLPLTKAQDQALSSRKADWPEAPAQRRTMAADEVVEDAGFTQEAA